MGSKPSKATASSKAAKGRLPEVKSTNHHNGDVVTREGGGGGDVGLGKHTFTGRQERTECHTMRPRTPPVLTSDVKWASGTEGPLRNQKPPKLRNRSDAVQRDAGQQSVKVHRDPIIHVLDEARWHGKNLQGGGGVGAGGHGC